MLIDFRLVFIESCWNSRRRFDIAARSIHSLPIYIKICQNELKKRIA